jgi:aspartokinase-like uncharacterized kinase
MWVVKIGGSLGSDPVLPHWLDLLAQLGGGRVTLVCGGGMFADEVRRAQAHWHIDDLPAHNMAVLAMAQTAYLAHGLSPTLQPAVSRDDIRRVLHKGQTALWMPFELQRAEPDATTTWDITSDSIALELARQLNAERLVVVKSCPIDRSLSMSQLAEAGVVDRAFATGSDGASFAIDLLQRDELPRMRSMLLGEMRPIDA